MDEYVRWGQNAIDQGLFQWVGAAVTALTALYVGGLSLWHAGRGAFRLARGAARWSWGVMVPPPAPRHPLVEGILEALDDVTAVLCQMPGPSGVPGAVTGPALKCRRVVIQLGGEDQCGNRTRFRVLLWGKDDCTADLTGEELALIMAKAERRRVEIEDSERAIRRVELAGSLEGSPGGWTRLAAKVAVIDLDETA